jgi:DNA-3-methyladenine glycosylase I
MRAYHDDEWGRPSADDRHLFEKMCLETFQCGLSWSTVLVRRERLREVFSNFDVEQLVRFTSADVDRIAGDPSIIRHRGKITAVLGNARACRKLIDEVGSLAAYLWSFAPPEESEQRGPRPPATSPESTRLSKDLKARGWTFVGPTTMYALMQSIGMVNDHDLACSSREAVSQARSLWNPPSSRLN